MVAPLSAVDNLVALKPKSTTGDRPIGISSSWYMTWAALRSPSAQPWETAFVQFCDTAIRGSSSLGVALMRRHRDEQVAEAGGLSLSVFWDMTKFYDTISIDAVIKLGQEAE